LPSAREWVDGEAQGSIPLDDRGLNYADGAFETMSCLNGEIACRSLHSDRLALALGALHFSDPKGLAQRCFDDMRRCVKSVQHSGTARLTVTRGSGPRGYTPPESVSPRHILTLFPPLEMTSSAQICGIAHTRWAHQPQLAGLKLLARTEQVLAAQEAAAQQWDDALMLDAQDHVISTTRGNIFAFFGSQCVTPDLSQCGIAGTRRQLLIESVLPELNYSVNEQCMTLKTLREADSVLISNTVRGVVAISRIEDQHYPECTLSERVQDGLIKQVVSWVAR
jgi:4-amino-4-deoxychorismate lyase